VSSLFCANWVRAVLRCFLRRRLVALSTSLAARSVEECTSVEEVVIRLGAFAERADICGALVFLEVLGKALAHLLRTSWDSCLLHLSRLYDRLLEAAEPKQTAASAAAAAAGEAAAAAEGLKDAANRKGAKMLFCLSEPTVEEVGDLLELCHAIRVESVRPLRAEAVLSAAARTWTGAVKKKAGKGKEGDRMENPPGSLYCPRTPVGIAVSGALREIGLGAWTPLRGSKSFSLPKKYSTHMRVAMNLGGQKGLDVVLTLRPLCSASLPRSVASAFVGSSSLRKTNQEDDTSAMVLSDSGRQLLIRKPEMVQVQLEILEEGSRVCLVTPETCMRVGEGSFVF